MKLFRIKSTASNEELYGELKVQLLKRLKPYTLSSKTKFAGKLQKQLAILIRDKSLKELNADTELFPENCLNIFKKLSQLEIIIQAYESVKKDLNALPDDTNITEVINILLKTDSTMNEKNALRFLENTQLIAEKSMNECENLIAKNKSRKFQQLILKCIELCNSNSSLINTRDLTAKNSPTLEAMLIEDIQMIKNDYKKQVTSKIKAQFSSFLQSKKISGYDPAPQKIILSEAFDEAINELSQRDKLQLSDIEKFISWTKYYNGLLEKAKQENDPNIASKIDKEIKAKLLQTSQAGEIVVCKDSTFDYMLDQCYQAYYKAKNSQTLLRI